MSIYTGSYIINGISGIWNSYGCPVNPSEGLFLSVEESEVGDESLVSLMDFDTEKKRIGVLKDSKTVFELVVMLPMLEKDIEYVELPPLEPTYTPPVDPCAPCDEKIDSCSDTNQTTFEDIGSYGDYIPGIGDFSYIHIPISTSPSDSGVTTDNKVDINRLKYCPTEDAWLFTIKESIINKILDVENYKNISINTAKNILESRQNLNNNNTIVKLMKAMVKYNFPPHLNWLAFPDKVPPYAMYVAEFSTVFNKHDLSNIWQGSMPRAAEEPAEEVIEIEHYLTDEEIFGGFNITEMNNIKLSVFKCKMRATNSYINSLKQTARGERKDWYQYNWPYDNFSLVELLKVDAGEVREFTKPEDIAESVIITDQSGTQFQVTKENYTKYYKSYGSK